MWKDHSKGGIMGKKQAYKVPGLRLKVLLFSSFGPRSLVGSLLSELPFLSCSKAS